MLVILFSVCAVYYASVFNDFVALDDSLLLVHNPNIHELSWRTLRNIFTSYDPELYIPLTLFTYQLQYLFFGLQPFTYHLVNLALHAMNALLLFMLVYALSKSRSVGFIAALLFAVHPVNVEAVAWIAARKDLLSTACFLAAFVSYLRAERAGSRSMFAASIFLFFLGLLSKVTIVILPLLLLLADWYEGKDMRSRRVYTQKIPFVLLSVVFCIIAIVGKVNLFKAINLLPSEYFGLVVQSAVFAGSKIVFPVNLSVAYPLLGSLEILSLPSVLSLLLIVLLGALSLVQYYRYKRKLPLFSYLFFLLSYAQSATNLVKGGEIYLTSDRYVYIAQIGVLMLVAWGLTCLVRRSRIIGTLFTALLIVLLGTVAVRQTSVWYNTDTLFDHAASIYPQAPLVHRAKGIESMNQGDFMAAVRHFLRSPEANPGPYELSLVGKMLYSTGKIVKAKQTFEFVLSISPEYGIAHEGIAKILQDEGKNEESLSHYLIALKASEALISSQKRVVIYNNMAALYQAKGDHEKEIEYYNKAVALDPSFPYAYYNLGAAYTDIGQPAKAIDAYRKGIELLPSLTSARVSYAKLLLSLKRNEEAIAELSSILKQHPEEKEAASLLTMLRGAP